MSLNPEQLAAIQHVGGPLLILAGAGTGKTRVLTHRMAYLVEQGISPGRILAVTFTNKAAAEMKKRVEVLVGPRARELWVGTFHSVCVKILRRHPMEAGIAQNFVIYDSADQTNLIKEVLKELNLDEKRFSPSSLVGSISRLKDQLITVEMCQNRVQNPFQKTLAQIYEVYQKKLEKNYALDFGDLIFRCVLLLENHPQILAAYQERWLEVLIDEYQDTNQAQYRFASLLVAKHHNICVVGDPDQSIYRWRGADIHNILNFEKEFHSAKVVRLEQNYRSVQNILKAASVVIAHNELRKEKVLWSNNEAGEKLKTASLTSEKEEAKYIVEQFRVLHRNEKIPFSEMAVFYRTNAQSRPFEEYLRMSGIPYQIYGGIRFYERAEIKDALAYLRIFNVPQDSVSFKRVVNCPPRGIGKTTLDRIGQLADQEMCSYFDAAQKMDHSKLNEFLQWFASLKSKMNQLSLVDLLKTILEESGYIKGLVGRSPSETQERLENINELVASLYDFEKNFPGGTLTDYLEQVALISDIDQESSGGVLSLMTLHLAKGLEFRAVAICGAEEGLLPHARSIDDPAELEEERRLFYVGITRAKERLVISRSWRRFLNGREQYGLPSRFLEEIPSELKENFDASVSQESGWSYDFDAVYNQDQERAVVSPKKSSSQGSYPVGSRVKHPDFGIGLVAATEKTSLGEKVTVRFKDGSLKKLIAQIARLERI